MKQFFSLLDGMMEYRQLKEAIEQGRVPVSLTGAAAAHKTHIIASLVYQLQRPALVIVPDESTAIRFAADLNTLLGERVLHFPARDYVLLDVDGASGEFEHQRLGTLSALLRGEARVVVASAESACERTIPKEKLAASILEIDQDGSYDEEEIVQKLVAMGYQHRDQVEGICQFARRGGILDIFPPDRTQPVRIEFWDDSIDTMSTFQVDTQRRQDPVERVREITDGAMADYVQDCVGAEGVPIAALKMLKKAGTYGITGLYHTLPQVDLGDVVRREIKIFGTICYTRQEFEECLHFVEDGRVKVEPFITHHFPLKDMEKAYEVYQSKQCIKIILNP